MPGDAVGTVAVAAQADGGEGLTQLAGVDVVESAAQPCQQRVRRLFSCQVVKTHQPGHVDHRVVHLAAFRTPRHPSQQRVQQLRSVCQPAGPELDEGAVTELSSLVVLEQRALQRDPHGDQSIAHQFDYPGSTWSVHDATGVVGAATVLTVTVAELGAYSEVGALRVVILHRPGAELRRLNPRNNDQLLFDGLPWVSRAQEEHDQFAELLRSRGVEVLLLSDLLIEALASGAARMHGVGAAVDARRLGAALAQELSAYLRGLDPVPLAHVLTAGMTFNELPPETRTDVSLVLRMHHEADFVIEPLPNLVFTRDSSIWVGPRVVIPSLALRARVREASLTDLIYAHHPRFTGVRKAYESRSAPVEGGDVLLLAPGVIAVGVGERTTPAGAEALARSLFDDDLAHTVLAVPIAQRRAQMHLDTVCTMVDTDTVVMYANVVDTLTAFTMRRTPHGVAISDAAPFLEAAATAMGIDKLRVIDTGLDPVIAEREQWDDGNNTLALEPGVVVAYERNVQTNARLQDAGIEVLTIAGSELGTGRGGPRCMSCPAARDPL